MHDPKFEKEVQQKLEELSFSPSDAVWSRVELAVNGKKRRRVPVFWLFLLPMLVLTGAGLVYFTGTRKNVAEQRVDASRTQGGSVAVPGADKESSKVGGEAGGNDKELVAGDKDVVNNKGSKVDGERMKNDEDKIAIDQGMIVSGKDVVSRDKEGVNTGSVRNGKDRSNKGGWKAGIGKENVIVEKDQKEGADKEENVAGGREAIAAITMGAYQQVAPGLNGFDRHFSAPGAARLKAMSPSAVAATSTIQLEPKHTWEMGFAGGIGASSINKTLFQQPVVMTDLSQNAAPINGRPKSYTSQVRPDLSYWAGIVAQRPLTKNLTLSLGLDLHYYSAKVQVGEKVYANASYMASSLIMPATPPATQSAAYPAYSVGNNDVFVNRYYFLELPGSIVWQVNHSRNLPLFWEAGVSLSYLVSSNAVYYNAKSSVFYKDGSVTNKAQFNLATALLVGLPIRGIRMQVGPQIQYGLTSLQNQGSGGQHLFYGGLRVVLLPGKTKK